MANDTCPYCKIDFTIYPWARGTQRTVCRNCKNFADAVEKRKTEAKEMIEFGYVRVNGRWVKGQL